MADRIDSGQSILLALTPLAFRNSRSMRIIAYLVATIQTLNGLHHIVLFFVGHSVNGIVFRGPAPGVYSWPALLAAAAFMFWTLRRTAPAQAPLVSAF